MKTLSSRARLLMIAVVFLARVPAPKALAQTMAVTLFNASLTTTILAAGVFYAVFNMGKMAPALAILLFLCAYFLTPMYG